MKYKLICLLISASLLVACEKDPIDTKGNAISFNNSPARAAKVEAPNDNARMWAYYYNTDNSTTITKMVYGTESAPELATLSNINTTEGTASLTVNGNTKYWFVGTYNFFSIYSDDFKNGNLSDATLNTSTHTLTFNYDIINQKELRYATALNEDGGNAITSDGASNRTDPVELNYKHLLSKIKFQGFSTDASNPITVTKVEISSIPRQAKVSLKIADATGIDTKSLTAIYDKVGTSTGLTTENNSGWVCDKDNGYVVFEKMVFPQSVTATTENPEGQTIPDGAVKFTVTYNTSSETGKTKSAFLPSSTWEAGKSYLYKFKIQPSGPIIFGGVSVTDWSVQPETEFDFPTEP